MTTILQNRDIKKYLTTHVAEPCIDDKSEESGYLFPLFYMA